MTPHKKLLCILGIFFLFVPVTTYALSSEIHVTKDGKASVSAIKVMQIAGSTFYVRLYWGDAFVRMTIKTNSTTKFLRATDEPTTIKEVREGDILDVVGELQSGTDTLTLTASSIKNSSVQKEQTTFSGIVTAVDFPLRTFTLNSKERGAIIIKTATSTQFSKGTRMLDLEHVRVGDHITKTAGDYDIPSKTLSAQSVTTYVDLALFKPRLFVGTLAETPTSVEVASIKVAANGALFTVFINDKTTILRNNRAATTLQRFVLGDTIRLYGTRREVDEPIIDAEVIRNTNL